MDLTAEALNFMSLLWSGWLGREKRIGMRESEKAENMYNLEYVVVISTFFPQCKQILR